MELRELGRPTLLVTFADSPKSSALLYQMRNNSLASFKLGQPTFCGFKCWFGTFWGKLVIQAEGQTLQAGATEITKLLKTLEIELEQVGILIDVSDPPSLYGPNLVQPNLDWAIALGIQKVVAISNKGNVERMLNSLVSDWYWDGRLVGGWPGIH